MDYRGRRFHARGMYSTQDNSRMGTARVKQQEEADTRIIVYEHYEIWKEGKGYYKEEKLQTRPD